MNTELATLQNELTIARQQNEIMDLRYKLQVTQAEKVTKLEDSLFSPALYDHYQKVATMLAKTNIVPNSYKGKPEDVFVAMAMGYKLGFPIEQSLQDIAVVNGRPCLWGDGLLALALSHPEGQIIDEQPITDAKNNIIGYQCTVLRKGHSPHVKKFTLQDATTAGLLKKGGVWSCYPSRMLQMRARSLALRDKFADALRGIRIAEIEQEDATVIDAQAVIDVPATATQTDRLKKIIGINEGETHAQEHPARSAAVQLNDTEYADISEQQGDREIAGESDDLERHTEQSDNDGISDDDLVRIEELFVQKSFNNERITKALEYYKVSSTAELSAKQARRLINQLEKL